MQIVRNRRIPGRERPSRPFERLYEFANLFNLLLVSSVALLTVYVIILLVANLVSPKFIKDMDETMTENMVEYLHSRQNYEPAISLLEMNPDYVETDGNASLILAECYEKTGAYSNALKYYLGSYQLLDSDEVKNQLNPSVLRANKYALARTICHVYYEMGDMDRAHEFLQIMEETYDDSVTETLSSFADSVARILGKEPIGDFSWRDISPEYEHALIDYSKTPIESIERLRRTISGELGEKRLNTNVKIRHLNTLIGWEIENNMSVAALWDINMAVALSDSTYRWEHFEYFGHLAEYCKWAKDEDSYDRLMSAYRRYLFNSHKIDSPEALLVVKYLVDKGKYYQAEGMLMKICDNLRSKIQANIPIMSDDQREHYIKTIEEPFAYSEDLLTDHPSPRLAKLVATNTLFKKGLLLRSNRNQRNAILSQGDEGLIAMYDELVACRKEYNIIKNVDRPEQIIRKSFLEKRIFKLDKELAEACAEYIEGSLLSEMSVDGLKADLGKNGVFLYLSSNRNGHLFALELSNRGGVKYIDISKHSDVDINSDYSPDMLYTNPDIAKALLGDLSFDRKGKRVYYCSTSGLYNRIAVPAIQVTPTDHLMDIADIRIISDPTLIGHLKSKEINLSGRVSLWGGVRYSEHPDSLLIDDGNGTHRGINRGDRLVYLPSSLLEVQGIAAILSDSAIDYSIYTEWNATEDSFKEHDGNGDRIIHISTHGFFNDYVSSNSLESAMDNSGLLFAGAEKYWTVNPVSSDVENDGILKSSEIELMDLNGCSLVVLSACETGLGFDDNSEGVYGLQRAFKLAGADKVLMSLWEIPDEETSQLMQWFYQFLLKGDDPNIALEKAQKKIREKDSSPESWGGFVLLN